MTPPFDMTVCGIEELAGHCSTGATHVLSILDPDHPVPEAFGTFGEHAKVELRFHDIIEDRAGEIAPQREHVAAILTLGRGLQAAAGRAHLLVHCHAGISRSTASMVLILAQAVGRAAPPEAVLGAVHAIREKAWPNLRMMEMGDAMLGWDGALVTATHRLHRLQLDRRPHLAELMEQLGRAREVAVARTHEALGLVAG